MRALAVVGHLAALLVLPLLVVGLVNRTKALWAGRKGLPIWQALFDLVRLAQKRPVYSAVTTPLFRMGPSVLLGTALVSGLVVPVLGLRSPVSFPYDFVFFAYAWGLGRVFLMVAALDTGSSFEGMGASREATYSALVEPVLFLVLGTLAAASGHTSFSDLLLLPAHGPAGWVTLAGCVAALFIVLQVESARLPVDDPNTHLELTMIHEVMILDHSGPDLAVMQYAAAVKLTLSSALIAALVNPLAADPRAWVIALSTLGLVLLVAVLVGTVESLIARLKLSAIPQYVLVALAAAFVALLSSTWRQGGAG
jgi:formate hydrogenlyase subunit 4